MDTIRIETSPNGNRIGRLISAEYERKLEADYATYEDYHQVSLVNHFLSQDVLLIDEGLPIDGDYNLDEFERVYPTAPIVETGKPTPTSISKDCYRYVANEEPI